VLGATTGSVYVFQRSGRGPLQYRQMVAINDGEVTALAFAPNDNVLAVGTAKGAVVVFELNLDSSKEKTKVRTRRGWPALLTMAGSRDNAVCVAFVSDRQVGFRYTDHKDRAVTALDWSSTGERLVSGDDAGQVFVAPMGDKVTLRFVEHPDGATVVNSASIAAGTLPSRPGAEHVP